MSFSRPETSSVETRFADHVKRNGINWQKVILDLDKVQTGVLSVALMRRFLESSAFSATDSEFRYVTNRYDDKHNGYINYRSFLTNCKLMGSLHETIEAKQVGTPRVSSTMRTSISNLSEINHEELLSSMRKLLHENRSSLRNSLLDFDKVSTGHVASDQFRRGLERCGINLPDNKINYLVYRYESKQLPRHVEWASLCDELESVPYAPMGLSKPRTPSTPKAFAAPRSSKTEFRRISNHGSFDKQSILRRINDAMRTIDDSIRLHFLEFDKAGDGIVSTEEFKMVFQTLGISISNPELDGLANLFSASAKTPNLIRYVDFLSELDQIGKSVSFSKDQSDTIESKLKAKISNIASSELMQAFKSFDNENYGYISSSRFKQVLDRYDIIFPDEEIDHILQKHGFQKEDTVSYPFFVEKFSSMTSVPPSQPRSSRSSSASSVPVVSNIPQLKLTPRPPPGPPQNISAPSNAALDSIASPEVRQAIARVQFKLVDSKARINEFLKDYDKLRCGVITEMQFRRGVDLSGVRLNESEIKALVGYYQGKHPGTVQWLRFCDDVDSVFTIKHLEKTPRHSLSTGRGDLKYQATESRAPQVEAIVKNVLNRLQEVIARQRIIPLPPFQDFDRLNCRRVTVTQFQQSLAVLGLSVKEVEMDAIVKKYGIEFDGLMTVKYREFLDDLKASDKHGSDHAHLSKLEQILREKIVQNVGGSGHLRKAFRFFDRDMTGHITETQFGNVCRQLGLNLTDEEVKGLMSRYDTDQDGTIDYHEFIDRLLPKDYSMEKAPTAFVVKQVEIPKYLPRTINTSITEIPLLLAKMKALIISKDIRLRDFFVDYDLHRRGVISREQFQRGLGSAGFKLEDGEIDVLLAHYMSKEPDLVRWTSFVDDICSAIIPKDLERNPNKEVKYVHPRELIIESLGGSPSETLAYETRMVMKRIGEEVLNRRIFEPIDTLFRDFDHHHVRQVIVENFKKVMKSFDIAMSPKDIEVLVARYGEVVDSVLFFRYSEFMSDLRDAANPVPDNPRIKKILEKLREKVAQRITGGHFEIRRAFRCFDRDGSGQITESEFKEMLVNYAIFVSDEDLHDLVKYIDSEGRGFVGYNDFVDKCLPKDYSGLASASNGAQEKPRAREHYNIPTTIKKPQRPRTPVDVDAIIKRLVEYVSQHRIRLAEYVKGGDIRNLDMLSFDQFHRALSQTGFKIETRESEALATRFTHTNHPGNVDWVMFQRQIDGNKGASVLESTVENVISNPPKTTQTHTPSGNSISSLPDGAIKQLLSRISSDITRGRIMPKQYFQDYDRSNISRISRAQFQRALGLTRIPMSTRDYEVLWPHFESTPDQVDYAKFCNLVSGAA